MKLTLKSLLSVLLAVMMLVTLVPAVMAEGEGDVVVLYTNDVHNAYVRADGVLGYPAVAQRKAELESEGKTVILVDCGDAIQGGVIGSLSKGKYIVSIMEDIGYDFAIPGNHEFDFGMDNFLEIADEAQYKYLSCNFTSLETGEPVLDAYSIVEAGGMKIAFVGVSTPETFTKSTPKYFQNEDGEYIYSFAERNDGADLYAAVQTSVDAAIADGADKVILLAHLGTDESSKPWTSEDVAANTTGIDVILDGHSHSTIESEAVTNKNGEEVYISSTGTKLAALGEMTITADGETFKLDTDIPEDDASAQEFVDGITAQFNELVETVVAQSEVNFIVNDPETGKRVVRTRETNLGDFCADAYRTLLGADIAFVNGGGVRANIESGDITYGQIINVHPFGNEACLVKVTGQQILDALELGAMSTKADPYTGESGGFLQVSGLTYEIDTTVPSHVVRNDKNEFVKVDGERRVKNVMVAGKAIDPKAEYTLASHNYMLLNGGDGYTMFKGCEVLQENVMLDNQVLINYMVETLGGNVSEDSIYANPYGEGRIRIITEKNYIAGYQKVFVVGETILEKLNLRDIKWKQAESFNLRPTPVVPRPRPNYK